MPRLPRVHLEGVLYLVTSRGDASTPLFQDQQDYDTYLRLVGEYKTRYGFKLFAYCLFPDHLQLCLELAAGTTISAVMHDITAGYTRYFNKRYARTGHLFQERFKAALVEKQPFLLSLTAYLHSASRQAGLVRELGAYPFSSYRRYGAPATEAGTTAERGGRRGSPESEARGTSTADRLDMDAEIREVLELLPTAHTETAYEEYVNQLSTDEVERLRQTFQQRIVGSDEFVRLVRQRLNPVTPPTQATSPVTTIYERANVPKRPQPLSLLVAASLAAVIISGVIVTSLQQRIGFLRQTILALSQENEARFRAQYSLTFQRERMSEVASLEGTEWDIRLMPMGAEAQTASPAQQDYLAFTRSQVSSTLLASQGFPDNSNYTVTLQPNGTLLWGTMQTHPKGDVVSWRGEQRGETMRGIVTRQSAGNAPENFTFVGVVRKVMGATTRSET